MGEARVGHEASQARSRDSILAEALRGHIDNTPACLFLCPFSYRIDRIPELFFHYSRHMICRASYGAAGASTPVVFAQDELPHAGATLPKLNAKHMFES